MGHFVLSHTEREKRENELAEREERDIQRSK